MANASATDPSDINGPASKEYYYLQELIGQFNKDCLEIKKWSVALTSFAAIFTNYNDRFGPVSLFIILVLSLAFWITEAVWRATQFAFIRRVRQMEATHDEGVSPDISYGWARFALGKRLQTKEDRRRDWGGDKKEHSWGRLLGAHFFDRRTLLPHGIVAAIAAGLLVWLWLNPVEKPKPKPEATLQLSVTENGTIAVTRPA